MWPFRKRVKPVEPFLDDPVFGRITFDHETWVSLPVEDNGFVVSIDADVAGPSDVQRTFFRQLRPMLGNLQARAAAFVRAAEDRVSVTGKPFGLEDMNIHSLEIGGDDKCRNGNFVMEFADGEAVTVHRLEFANYIPISYGEED